MTPDVVLDGRDIAVALLAARPDLVVDVPIPAVIGVENYLAKSAGVTECDTTVDQMKEDTLTGDKRLLPPHCHMEPQQIHWGKIEKHHPDIVETFHPSQHQIWEHDGRLRKRW